MNLLFLILLFLISPFFAMIASFWMLSNKNMTNRGVYTCIVVISLFWGLLAFSQKSLAIEDTDCIRYYLLLEPYELVTPLEGLQDINILELLYFIFYPVSIIAISLTGNVQIISFLWTFIAYIFTYISIKKIMDYYGTFTQFDFAKVLIICTFCFMSFVQISELLKNSAAFAVFFYALTLYITKGNKIRVITYIFISVGLHTSVVMLIPLFLYKVMKTKLLIIIGIGSLIISSTTNIIDLLINILPGSGYFELLQNQFSNYGEGETGSTHYVILQLALLCPTLYLWIKYKNYIDVSYAVNLVLLYFIISNFNFYNLVAYLRLSIFSHWLFTLILIKYIEYSRINININKIKYALIVSMFFMTVKWTYSRTLSGGYCSSYMDNSIPKIILSTSYSYLSEDYEK